jgi:hypothetical protein
MKNRERPNLNYWSHTNNYRVIGARREFLALIENPSMGLEMRKFMK